MLVDRFNFDLPEDRIALRPVRPRDAAQMLVVSQDRQLLDKHISDLPLMLRPGDALVINNTKVIHARLKGQRIRKLVRGNTVTEEVYQLNCFFDGELKVEEKQDVKYNDVLEEIKYLKEKCFIFNICIVSI